MTPDTEQWFAKQDKFEANLIKEIQYLFERLNFSHFMRYQVLQQAVVRDSKFSDFYKFSSLVQDGLIKRYEYLTGKKYVFCKTKPKKEPKIDLQTKPKDTEDNINE